MAQLHSTRTANHRPYADVYADAAARLAATGFTRALGGGIVAFAADDLYKKVLQLDNASEWILTAITPTWVQVAGGASGSAGGALSGSYPNPDLAAGVAGSGLALASNVLSVNVDSSTIEINSDTLRQKDDGTTNAKLANMAQSTIKGRASGAGTGDPTDLSASQVRSIMLDMQRWTINFTADGDAYIAADVAMTIDAGVAAIGTGTLTYQKSTAASPSSFSSTSLPATLEAGAWLKVSVSSLAGFKAVELKRTA